MKENWMNKLIELVNEYEWYTDIPTWTLSWANEPLYWWWTAYASAYLIPSKKFWFIKWLVDNDKIDFNKCWRCYEINSTYDHYNLEDKQDLWLIMLLSISDTPIEDLISYLK